MQDWQRRRIFGYGKRLRFDLEDLREIAAQYNGGKLHVSKLNYVTAGEMIKDLARQVRQFKGTKYITAGQKRHIKGLYSELEWSEWEFNTWLQRWHKFYDIDAKGITLKKAQNIIEGLKAMVRRKRKKEEKAIEEAKCSIAGYA